MDGACGLPSLVQISIFIKKKKLKSLDNLVIKELKMKFVGEVDLRTWYKGNIFIILIEWFDEKMSNEYKVCSI